VARSALEQSAAIAREVGDRWGLGVALGQLAAVAQSEGDYATAGTLRAESAVIAREIGDRDTLGTSLMGLAVMARAQAEHAEAAALWKEALIVSSEIDHPWSVLRALAGLAGLATVAADHERAARLFGAVEALREASGTREAFFWRAINDRDLADVRASLGDETFAAAWAEGRAMTLEQAVAYALDKGRSALSPARRAAGDHGTSGPSAARMGGGRRGPAWAASASPMSSADLV
jgi:hypothetical protein